MNGPYHVTVTVDEPAWTSPFFEAVIDHELACTRAAFLAERERRLAAERDAFWRDIGRPPDAHLGAVGGE
jgi:hypothetical protein